jgi:hypothetical protein
VVHRSPSFHLGDDLRFPSKTKKSVPDDPARFEARKGICFVLQTAVAPALHRGSFAREATLVPLPKPRMKLLLT